MVSHDLSRSTVAKQIEIDRISEIRTRVRNSNNIFLNYNGISRESLVNARTIYRKDKEDHL